MVSDCKMSSLIEGGSRAARRALGSRLTSFAHWLRRNGRPLAAYSVEGLALEVEHGTMSSAAMTMWGSIIDTLATGADFEWSMNAATRYSVPAAAATIGYVAGSGSVGGLVQSVGEKRVRSSDIPKEQRYKKLKTVPKLNFKEQDGTALDLIGSTQSIQPSLKTPVSSKIPKLSTLARRVVAQSKRKAWLIRHTRKARAAALQAKYIPTRLKLARLRRKRFVRRWVRSIRTRIGKKRR